MPPLTIFLSEDAKKLLHNKYVVIIGDSNQRGIYKDFIALLQGNEYLSSKDLKAKGEKHFMNDELVEGGRFGKMSNGTNYREVRQYTTDYHLVRFYFITKIHNKYWEEVIFPDLEGEPVPDVVIINSCLWDLSRYETWGSAKMESYKRNVEKTFSKLNSILPLECLVLWNTTLPVASKIKGGFMLSEIKHVCETLRLDVMQANFYTKELAKLYDVDVLDLSFYFRHQMHRQVGDGTHWNYMAHRRITNLILAHIAVAWGVGLPRGVVPASSSSPARLPPSDVLEPTASSLYTNFDKVESQGSVRCEPAHPKDTSSRSSTAILSASKSVEHATVAQGSETNKSGTTSISVCHTLSSHSGISRSSGRSSPVLGSQPSGDIGGGKCLKPLGQSDGTGDHRSPANSSLSIKGVSLPAGIKLNPIDVSAVDHEKQSSPFKPSSSSRKERVPKAGNRFQPYIHQQQSYPPAQQYQQPLLQSYQQPSIPYSQARFPYHVNSGMHNTQYYPYAGGQIRGPPHPPVGQMMNAFRGVNPMNSEVSYNQYVARVNQRIEAERCNQMTRDLLYEALLRFN